jgi:putative transposase
VVKAPSFPMAVLTDIRNRGVKDVFFLVCDGLKGLPEVVANVWPQATVQTCIIHLIRGSFRLSSRKYWDERGRDLRPIYTAASADAARAAFDDMVREMGRKIPSDRETLGQRVGRVHSLPGLLRWRSEQLFAPRMPSKA